MRLLLQPRTIVPLALFIPLLSWSQVACDTDSSRGDDPPSDKPADVPSDDAARAPSAIDAFGDRIGSFFDVFVGDEDDAFVDGRGPVIDGGLGAAPKSRALVSGWGHTCATLATSGDVYCWGFGSYGNLGDRQRYHQAHPVQAIGLTDIDDVAAGAGHTCALRDGNVLCFGDYRYGQTGRCAADEEPFEGQLVPRPVVGLPFGKTTAIVAGESHNCALVDGGVMCWGDNLLAQLGSGGQGGFRGEADWVPGLEAGAGVIALGAGFYHTCAALSGGGMMCWGNNTFCQSGQGPECKMGGVGPAPVVGLNLSEEVVAIAGGGLHTCALFDGGSVVCWGSSSDGQLGSGTRGLQWFPSAVTGLDTGVTAITAGESTTCAVKSGQALCWGSNTWGKLGVGEGGIPTGCVASPGETEVVGLCTTPTPVRGLASGVAEVAAGFDHTCARLATGGVKCWGNGGYGSVGNNRFDNYVPEPVNVVWAGYPGPGGTLPPVVDPPRCDLAP